MYYSLRGKLIYSDVAAAAIECAGVGYMCYISMSTYAELPAIGEEVMLYTHLSVREDAMDLYGFATESERRCFKILTSVSGVGAKVGLAILSILSADQVALAIMGGDAKTFTAASGVGPKLAQRIVLELKDKFKGAGDFGSGSAVSAPQLGSSNVSEAIAALVALGYTQGEAVGALSGASAEADVQDLIRGALRQLGTKF